MSDQASAALAPHTDFGAFVPQDRRAALLDGVELPERARGAALFADLSGFTSLTERLARTQGPLRGAETLSLTLRRVFEALIGEIEGAGGSVLGFSGDAITCWFDRDDGKAAVAAGFAMQRRMASIPETPIPGEEPARLRLKVAVAVGPVGRFVVGDASVQRIDIIAGRTLDALAAAEHAASPGEVVFAIGEGTAPPLLDVRLDGDADLAIGVVAPPEADAPPLLGTAPPSLEPALAASWVLPAVRGRLQEGVAGFLAGFRPAAALFLSFGGIDYENDPEAGGKLSDFVCWAQHVVEAHGGSLIQLTTGDKGSYLYAAFGAPVAHGDDAARAVAAALALVDTPRDHVRGRRAGLTHGSMFTGTYGSRGRCTYGVLGPMTNLAARLMTEAAEGQVLCSAELARLASRRYRMEQRGARKVKGVDDPVPVFVPAAEAAGASSEASELLGRDDELGCLAAVLEKARRGGTVALLVESHAGFGKTRLLRAATVEAQELGMEVLRGSVRAAGPEEPYGAWRGVVTDALGIALSDLDEARLRAALNGFGGGLGDYAGALDDILGIGVNAPVESDAGLRRQAVTAGVSLLLAARARRAPLAVVVDDAHRLDALSVELYAAVRERLERDGVGVAFVLARRLGEGSLEPRDASEVVPLPPLPEDVVERLLAQRLDLAPDALPDGLKALVRERSGGNPLVAEGLLRHLQNEGLVRVTRGEAGNRCELTGTPEALAAIPDTLQGLLLSQIDRLAPRSQLTLKVAATVGRQFVLPPVVAALDAVSGIAEKVTQVAVADLTERGLVDALMAAEGYRFRQALTQEVAYASLLFAQRRELHGALASWFRARASRDVAAIAHHAYHAAVGSEDEGRIAQAADAQIALAQQLLDLGAYADTTGIVGRGLSLLPESPRWASRRARLLVMNGAVNEYLSRYDEAETDLGRGLGLARVAGDNQAVANALDALSLVATRRGAHDDARGYAGKALEHALATADRAAEARARSRLGILAAYRGDFDEAAEQYRCAIALADELSDRSSLASSLSNLGLVRVYQREFEEARQAFQRALRMAEKLQSRHLRARFTSNLGLVDEQLGDLEAAEARYRQGLTLLEELGARQEALTLILNLGEVAVRRGRLEEARVSYRRALSESLALGAVPLALSAVGGLAWAAVRDGDPATAAELLGTAMHHPARDSEVEQHAEMVLAEIRAGLDAAHVDPLLDRGRATPLEDVARRLASEIS